MKGLIVVSVVVLIALSGCRTPTAPNPPDDDPNVPDPSDPAVVTALGEPGLQWQNFLL